MKAAVDAALVTKVVDAHRRVHAERQPLRQVRRRHQVQILQTWEIGGSNPQFWKGEFTHTPAVRGGAVLRGRRRSSSRSVCRRSRPSAQRGRRTRVTWSSTATSGPCGCPRSSPSSCRRSSSSSACSCCTGGSVTSRRRGREGKAASVAVPDPGRVRTDEGVTMVRRIRPSSVSPSARRRACSRSACSRAAGAQQLVDGGKEGRVRRPRVRAHGRDGRRHRRRAVLHGPRAQRRMPRTTNRRVDTARFGVTRRRCAAAVPARSMVRSMSASVCARLTNSVS